MMFKVGSTWFQVQPGQPLMLFLTDEDKAALANMAPTSYLYARFPDDGQTLTTAEEKYKWMAEGFEFENVDDPKLQQVLFEKPVPEPEKEPEDKPIN